MNPDDWRGRLEALHEDAYGWARACTRNAESAREIVQMTYVKVLEGSAIFDGRSEFKTWLFGVIRRTAADSRRRARRDAGRRVSLAPLRNASDLQADPESRAVESESAAHLRDALDRLPGRQREVLHLVFYQELTIEAAAAVLGLAVGTARTHYERGKRRLEELMPARVTR